ncbi:uncharacterized protein PFL1_03686 [Pseudozyma flocculosa PF-1]|uniref:DUF605-domain-containing protein n=2 Tax=Pseudozyma flocculosa TaxID=84751 RepID=A0A5C3F492_9BASI|nr:uncharacterized protein PFL1_03686 [Pseudozyma flocculosa PF-1]EPQ28885.1 hypothetical protein PFL1_03686 [Pseudozyma flocculosa PF-1]SPO39324.1 uncharacterized protein PSFLO_04805 [Pseudozyma flocculosa]
MDKPLEYPPPELKPLKPFIQRANELRTADRVISYWCLYYAAQLGIGANAKQPESKQFLFSLLDTLEALKAQLADNDAVTNDIASAAYVENFALKVFVQADNQDRAGRATRETASRFLAASQLLELLKVFNQLDPDMQAKIKYAKVKATDITKALKEGRKPHPGPAGGDPNEEAAKFEDAIARGLETKESREDDDAYLAREMARLTADAAGPAVPQAISPADTGDANPFDGETQNRKRAMSKARMSLHVEGSPLHSPNFSKPLQPQLPGRPDSASSRSAADGITPPTPPSAGFGGDGGGLIQRLSSPPAAAPGLQPLPPSQDASTRAPSNASADFLPIPASSQATSPSVLSGSRPLPVPPHRDGLPIPPSSHLQRATSAGGSASSSSPWPGSTNGMPSAPVSPNFRSTSQMADAASSSSVGAGPAQAPGFDIFQPSFPATPLAPPAPVPSAPGADLGSSHPSSAPIVHYALAPSAPQPIGATAASTAPATDAALPAPAKLPESLPLKLSVRAQKLAKSAASAVDFEDLDTARAQLRQALDILEGRVAE